MSFLLFEAFPLVGHSRGVSLNHRRENRILHQFQFQMSASWKMALFELENHVLM